MRAVTRTTDDAAAERTVARAAAQARKGRWDRAERLYRDALVSDPSHPEALFGLGTVARSQGRPDLAVPHLASALKAAPDRARYWFTLAETLIAAGRCADARTIVARFVARAVADPEASSLVHAFAAKLLAEAASHLAAGRPADAEALYASLHLLAPDDPDALHGLGLAAYRTGRIPEAIDLLGRAVAGNGGAVAHHGSLGNALFAAGRFEEASHAYGRALALDPQDAQVLHNLASALQALGRTDEAIGRYREAVALNPDYASAWNNLGLALHGAGRFDEAAASYRRALQAKPDDPDVLTNLGATLAASGAGEDAVSRYAAAIRLRPDHALAHNNLGSLLADLDRPEAARRHLEIAARLRPDIPGIHANLATLLAAAGSWDDAAASLVEAIGRWPADPDLHHRLGNVRSGQFRHEDAATSFATAARLRPGFPEALNNLGSALHGLGRTAEAEAAFTDAIAHAPGHLPAHNNLGNLLRELGRPTEAIASYRRALATDPNLPEANANLGATLGDLGDSEAAVAFLDRALALGTGGGSAGDDGLAAVQSNRLLTKMYMAGISPENLAADARSFGERFCDPLLRRRPFRNDPDPDRRLRIGFVSADFRRHPVSQFFEPALQNLERGAFETFAYAHMVKPDEVTKRLRGEFAHWRRIDAMSDETVADLVEADGIDILVDLSGHTNGHRLLVFARKPAPVQVTWIGFPGTTGLKAIDYRIADIGEPDGTGDALSVERLWRMPDMGVCYAASPASPAVIDHPPADDRGHVTFGCFNNFVKVSDPTLAAWASILDRVPDARLLLEIANIDKPDIAAAASARFHRLGLPLDRLDLAPRAPENQYVLYNRIDIALDPFPYNGGTTSMDTLWMGVPFVALEGRQLVSRLGFAMLTAIGLTELIGRSEAEYVEIARALALDRPRLRAVRQDLRGRMARSPLMDHALFGQNLGTAFRGMWREWAARQVETRAA